MTTQQRSTQAVLDSFFEKFGAGDLPGLLELFADHVDFRVQGSPRVPWTGTRTTKAEISEFFQIFPKVLTGPQSFTLTARIVDGQDAVVTADSVFGVLATAKSFTNSYALHVRVENARITRYHMYEDSYAIAEAFTE
ncbi:nuclear transport factor 2 family protein [Streptomyces sp. NPDC002740]|uniref:SnoaL-like domain-containing protein n=1 Tax=Streptomyces asoensis TaxID=249586 RepID=A0A6M4WRU1_9ACTN|nr:nuclear transport factor 2 family protein [Streptomyces asoensis]QJS99012.1 SnoaL-like domain-containing protein [Streptomyces asoensis]QJT06457.1 SnoaL-like domain-containing protein [Streptomyces asoensis]